MELLQLLGEPFEVVLPNTIESAVHSGEAARQASVLAERKALSVAAQSPSSVVIAADTVVVLGDKVMGKPPDAESARETLEALRGRQHQVISGLAVIHPTHTSPVLQAVETRVWMRHYSEHEIAHYISRGEPFDKAGAYAIQDRHFHPVERIEGCYANVMGLPLCHLYVCLEQTDYSLPILPVSACEARIAGACPVAQEILKSVNR